MTKTLPVVIPDEQRMTRNPGAEDWIPACAGMTDKKTRLKSAPWIPAEVHPELEHFLKLGEQGSGRVYL